MSKYNDIDALVDHIQYSPTTIHMHQLDMIERAMGGEIDIIDPNSPFIQLLELGATSTAACMQKIDSVTRKRYPRLAQTLEDLYPHMSDSDFAGIFASPVRNHIVTLGLGANQILKYAILDNVTGLRHVRIPRDTVFSASGLSFTFHQPIDITVFPNNEIRAQFDSSVASPILERKSNYIETRYGYLNDMQFFIMDIPCDQLNVVSSEQTVSSAQSWSLDIPIDDAFYYARGYYTLDGASWNEMHITLDGNTYDPINPTMVVRPLDGSVNVYIPDVFVTNNQVGISARVDVYTTKGKTEVNLNAADVSDWEAVWSDFSKLSTGFTSPLSDITSRVIFSTQISNGGEDGKTFSELREAVIYNKYGKLGAYTEEELKQELADLGYLGSLRKDTLTDRIYVATRSIDRDDLLKVAGLATGAGVINEVVEVNTSRTDLPYGLVTNATRAVLRPNTLYKESAGGITLVDESARNELYGFSKAILVEKLNSVLHLYTPFHTVLDYSSPVFQSRSYWLTKPKELYRNVLSMSSGLGFTIRTNTVSVKLVDDEYIVTVVADKPKSVTDIKLQLTFTDLDGDVVYLDDDATDVGTNEISFEFKFPTTFDLNSKHQLDTVAKDSTGADKNTRILLEQSFNLVYVVKTDSPNPTAFDQYAYVNAYSPDIYSAIAHEETMISFGAHLDGLYIESRTLLQPPVYEKYVADVPDVYLEDEYLTDANGRVMTVTDGDIEFTKVRSAGEQKELNGVLQWLHREGDVKRDATTGEPIILKSIEPIREIRLPLFDARFLFGETESLVTYRDSIPQQISDYLVRDISLLRESTFERTKLYFEPLATQQSTLVKVSEEREMRMRTALAFEVAYQVTVPAYDDSVFRQALEEATRTAIVAEIKGNKFALSSLISRLNGLAPGKVLNVTVNNPVGSTGVAEIQEELSSFSIDKSLRLQANGQLSIVDDIDISFIK